MAASRLDVAVVGAGVVGLAIARELSGRGARVAVFERSGIGAGASGVQPGGVRQQWGTPVACRLARESAAFYADADERLDAPVPLGFRACGYLFVAHTEATLARPGRERPRAERRRRAVAAGLARRGGRARPGPACRRARRRRLVCRGRLLRPARRASSRRSAAASTSGSARSPRSSRGSPTPWSWRRGRRPPTSCGRSDSSFRSSGRSATSSSASRSASACSSRSWSPPSAASPRSSSQTGGCSRAISARAATTRSGRRGGANVRAGIEELLPALAYVVVPRARPGRVRRHAGPPAAPRRASTTGSTSPPASAATAS